MRRPLAIAAVVTVATAAVFIAGVAGGHQASSVRDARAQSSRAAAAVRRASIQSPAPNASRRGAITKVCPRGAEGLGNSARRSIKRKLLGDDGRLDLGALKEMSNIAVATGRYLERKRAAPALPQRMGRVRAVGADGEEAWQPLPTPKVGCAMVPRVRRPALGRD